jgi:hypothetical protein
VIDISISDWLIIVKLDVNSMSIEVISFLYLLTVINNTIMVIVRRVKCAIHIQWRVLQVLYADKLLKNAKFSLRQFYWLKRITTWRSLEIC